MELGLENQAYVATEVDSSTSNDNFYSEVNMKNGMDSSKGPENKAEGDELRQKLKFFLANPCQRFCMEGQTLYARIPFKLIIQLLKIVFVTSQLMIVGQDRSSYANYLDRSTLALKHLLLKSWIPQYETMPYPPAAGVYGVYHIDDLYDHINFAVKQFQEAPETAMGSYYFLQLNGEARRMELCVTYYRDIQFYLNETLILHPGSYTECFFTNPRKVENSTSSREIYEYNVEEQFKTENITQLMNRMLEIKLKFLLHSIRLDTTSTNVEPDCFTHDGEIIFDNSDRNGQLLVDLSVTVSEFPCSGSFPASRTFSRDIGLSVAIIILTLLSLFFCFGSIISALKLMRATKRYFKEHLKKDLPCSDQRRFIKHWDILTIINDILTVSGIALRLIVQQDDNSNLSSSYDAATTLLGLGCLLVWIGILRYFSFFPKFYILFLTLNKALHNILRYMLCCVIIYAGFVFCGWAVLGPYNLKFNTLQSTAECLFATINGDELFMTLSGFTVQQDDFIWWFSRLYMYVYIALFTAIAINLFIAILTDTYESIKQYCQHGFPKTVLLEFIYEDEIYSPLGKPCRSMFCCLRTQDQDLYE